VLYNIAFIRDETKGKNIEATYISLYDYNGKLYFSKYRDTRVNTYTFQYKCINCSTAIQYLANDDLKTKKILDIIRVNNNKSNLYFQSLFVQSQVLKVLDFIEKKLFKIT
jgi:hypothetical protein